MTPDHCAETADPGQVETTGNDRARAVLAGGPATLAEELAAALERVDARIVDRNGGDVADAMGWGLIAALIRESLERPAEAGWWLGRAQQATSLTEDGHVIGAIREIAIALGVLGPNPYETRHAERLVDRVHAAVDHLDSRVGQDDSR